MKQEYQLETLTPVHIGTGETLNFMDGCYANGRWYRIDLDRVLAHPSTDLNALTSEMTRRDFRWQRYLSQRNMDPSELSNYSLSCPQSPENVEIREAIKTVDNRPYIPGSTLKGALRTRLLWDIVNNKGAEHYDQSLNYLEALSDKGARRNSKRNQPAHRIEDVAFGKDSNHNLLRALQVSDTEPLKGDVLEIGMAWTVTLDQSGQLVQKIDRGQEYKNFVQQIQHGQNLTFTLKIDELLFREREKTRLGFNELQIDAVQNIADVCDWVNADFIERERNFFDAYNRPEITDFYDRLIRYNDDLPQGAFLLQIGWGTGYHTNTITPLFLRDENSDEELGEGNLMDKESFTNLRKRFRLGESRSQREPYDKREFPKTRRILYRGQNPIAPLGWVKISPLKD